jgi:hypothetical protein
MQRILLLGVLLPVAASAMAMLLVTRLRRGGHPWTDRCGWEGALLAVIYAAVQLALDPWPGLPPGNIMQWPPFIAIAAAAASLGAGERRPRLHRALLALVVAGAATTLLLLRPAALSSLALYPALLWTALAVLCWLGLVAAWSGAGARTTPGAATTALAITAGASAAAMLLFDSLTYAQHIGIIALIMAVLAVFAWSGRLAQAGSRSVARMLAVILPGWWILSTTMSDLPRWGLPLLGLAGAASWLGAIPFVAALAPWKRTLLVGVLAALIVAPLMAWGVIQSLHQAQGHGDGY